MKKILLVIILSASLALPVWAFDLWDIIIYYSRDDVTPGVMDGAIANPAAVKIANPDGQNIGLN